MMKEPVLWSDSRPGKSSRGWGRAWLPISLATQPSKQHSRAGPGGGGAAPAQPRFPPPAPEAGGLGRRGLSAPRLPPPRREQQLRLQGAAADPTSSGSPQGGQELLTAPPPPPHPSVFLVPRHTSAPSLSPPFLQAGPPGCPISLSVSVSQGPRPSAPPSPLPPLLWGQRLLGLLSPERPHGCPQ